VSAAAVEYFKVSGGGNDFIALIEPERLPSAGEIAAWCRRGVSLGADGLFVLRRDTAGARMDYFNADGRPAALCINGTRCAARLAFEMGWAGDQLTITTGAGPLRARRSGATAVGLELGPPADPPRELAAQAAGQSYRGHFLEVGVPHFVLLWPESLARAPVAELGPVLRRHAVFGERGANVDFVRFPRPERLEIRTFERGVEAETLACGSGVLAAAATGVALGIARLPLTASTGGGFEMEVEGEAAGGRIVRWSLAGDARILARGTIQADASAAPAAPIWS